MPFNCKWKNQLRTRQIKAQSTTVFSSQRQRGGDRMKAHWAHQTNIVMTACEPDSTVRFCLWFGEGSWICGCDYGPYTHDRWVLEWVGTQGLRDRSGMGFRCICSCRAAAPGAGRCVCATPGGGCGCSGRRWEAAGGFARTRSGQSSHKTPEERATTDMSWRAQDIIDKFQSNTLSLVVK